MPNFRSTPEKQEPIFRSSPGPKFRSTPEEEENKYWEGLKDFGKNTLGAVAGVGDVLYGIPKMATTITVGAAGTAMGDNPEMAREAAGQAVHETMPPIGEMADEAFPGLNLRETQTYKATQIPFEYISEKIKSTGEYLGQGDSVKTGLIQQGIDLALFFLAPGAAKGAGKTVKGAFESLKPETAPKVPGGKGRTEPTMEPEVTRSARTGEPIDIMTIDVIGGQKTTPKFTMPPGEEGILGRQDPLVGDIPLESPLQPKRGEPSAEWVGERAIDETGQVIGDSSIFYRPGGKRAQLGYDKEPTLGKIPEVEEGVGVEPVLGKAAEEAAVTDRIAAQEAAVNRSTAVRKYKKLVKNQQERVDTIADRINDIPKSSKKILSDAKKKLNDAKTDLQTLKTKLKKTEEEVRARPTSKKKQKVEPPLIGDDPLRPVDAPEARVFPGDAGRRTQGGPGHKQGGAVNPEVIIEGLRKGAKSVKEFADRLAKELGEEYRPYAAALWKTGERALEEPKKEEKPTPPKGSKERLKYYQSDIRSPEVAAQEFAASVEIWTDIGIIKEHVLPGSNVAALSKYSNPVVKWMNDRLQLREREARMNTQRSKYGIRPTAGMRWKQHKRTDEGALTIFESLSMKDLEQAKAVWLDKYDGVDIPMTAESLAADGLNKRQVQGILAAREQLNKVLESANKTIEESGGNPIQTVPNFYPRSWEGDYRVFLKDAEGNVVKTWGAKTRREATTVAGDLGPRAKEHGYIVDWTELKNKYDLNDMSAFVETMRVLPKESPAYKSIQNAYNDIIRHRGFKKHGLQRKGAGGYLGSKSGRIGNKDFLSALGNYLDRANNFVSNQNKIIDWSTMNKELKKHGVDYQAEVPNSFKYLNRHVDNSTGGIKNQMEIIDNIVEGVGSLTGVGKSAPRLALSELNGLASAYWLSTAKFVGAQIAQPLYNLPKAIQLKIQGFTDKSIAIEFMRAQKQTLMPTKAIKWAVEFAKEHGYLDSKIVQLMGVKYENRGFLPIKMFRKGVSWSLGKVEQELVRTSSFIFYYNLLEKSIPNRESRAHTAGYLTDNYMVNYGRTDTPHMFAEAGMVGEAMKPLKQFQFAYWGQAIEYMQFVKQEKTMKSAAPFMAFLGVQATVSGAKGLITLAEATAIIVTINGIMGWEMQTPQEYLVKNNWPDWLTFGAYSWGMSKIFRQSLDFSGTLAAPGATDMIGAPGLGFAADMAKDVGTYAQKKARGVATEGDAMSAQLAVVPNALKGYIEEAHTEPGEPVPDPRRGMSAAMVNPRTTEDKIARGLGGRSLSEARERMAIKELRRVDNQRKKSKGELMDAIVDRLLAEDEGNLDKLIDRWVEKGGDGEKFESAVHARMVKRAKDWAEVYLGTQENLSQGQKQERLEEFGLEIEAYSPEDLEEFLREK